MAPSAERKWAIFSQRTAVDSARTASTRLRWDLDDAYPLEEDLPRRAQIWRPRHAQVRAQPQSKKSRTDEPRLRWSSTEDKEPRQTSIALSAEP